MQADDGRGAVAELVAAPSERPGEVSRKVLGLAQAALFGAEHERVVLGEHQRQTSPDQSVSARRRNGRRIQVYHAGLAAFGWSLHDLPPVGVDLDQTSRPAHRKPMRVEVDVAPPKCEQLAAAYTRHREHQPRRGDGRVDRRPVQEPPQLVARPDAHFGCPCLLRGERRGPIGRVTHDQVGVHGVLQGRPQDRVYVADRPG
jgi:hypothetical protein